MKNRQRLQQRVLTQHTSQSGSGTNGPGSKQSDTAEAHQVAVRTMRQTAMHACRATTG